MSALFLFFKLLKRSGFLIISHCPSNRFSQNESTWYGSHCPKVRFLTPAVLTLGLGASLVGERRVPCQASSRQLPIQSSRAKVSLHFDKCPLGQSPPQSVPFVWTLQTWSRGKVNSLLIPPPSNQCELCLQNPSGIQPSPPAPRRAPPFR